MFIDDKIHSVKVVAVTQYEVFGVCGVRFPGYFNGV